jgi:hypothetical protein
VLLIMLALGTGDRGALDDPEIYIWRAGQLVFDRTRSLLGDLGTQEITDMRGGPCRRLMPEAIPPRMRHARHRA